MRKELFGICKLVLADDAVEWAAAQPWSKARVKTYPRSGPIQNG